MRKTNESSKCIKINKTDYRKTRNLRKNPKSRKHPKNLTNHKSKKKQKPKPNKHQINQKKIKTMDTIWSGYCGGVFEQQEDLTEEFMQGLFVLQEKVLTLEKVKSDGMKLKDVDDVYKSNKEVVMAAVIENSDAIKYASPELTKDGEFVLSMVKKSEMVFMKLSEEFRKCKNFVTEVVMKYPQAIRYAKDELKDDLFFVNKFYTKLKGNEEDTKNLLRNTKWKDVDTFTKALEVEEKKQMELWAPDSINMKRTFMEYEAEFEQSKKQKK